MTISEMPRNRAKNPTQSSRSAPRAGNSCWEAQKPSTSSRMPTTRPSHQVLLTSLVMTAPMMSSVPLKTSSSPSTEARDQKASKGRAGATQPPGAVVPGAHLPRPDVLSDSLRRGGHGRTAVTGGWATPEPTAYDSSVDRSSPSVAQSAAVVSAALTPRAAEISADIYRLIVREIPQLRGDKRVLALLEASVGENVTTMLHVMQHGIDLEKVRAPAAA